MRKNRDRKQQIRDRMQADGVPYTKRTAAVARVLAEDELIEHRTLVGDELGSAVMSAGENR